VVNDVSRLFQTQCFRAGHLVLLAYRELANVFLPSADLAAEPQFETDFRKAVHKAVVDCLVAPITTRVNAFAKAAIFHPDICHLMQHDAVDKDVFDDCVSAVRRDIEALSGEGLSATKMTFMILDAYLNECKERPAAVFKGFEELKKSGTYGSTDALSFWRTIGKDVGNPMASLIPVASMLLALPAGESHNEFVFSSSGRVYTRDRNSLSPMRLEQVTVIVMFIRNFGWSQRQLMEWVKKAMAEVEKK
jgi:hypothetical protein